MQSPSRINTSGLMPLGHAVLVEPYEPEIKGGMIVIPEQVQQGMRAVDQRAVVIEVGPCAWEDEKVPRAMPGDRVLIAKFTGFIASKPITKDGKTYRIVNDRDVFCRINEE